jgi:hypothetical protein
MARSARKTVSVKGSVLLLFHVAGVSVAPQRRAIDDFNASRLPAPLLRTLPAIQSQKA